MANVAFYIGASAMILGGVTIVGTLVCLLGFGLSCAWIAFSDSFRNICKVESLIFEYRKNREEFLKWKERKNASNRTMAGSD